MGLGGAASASGAATVLLLLALVTGLAMVGVAIFASLDARDRFQRRETLVHTTWRRRLSRILLGPVVVGLWVASIIVQAVGGRDIGFAWTALPTFMISLVVCHLMGVGVRRLEFATAHHVTETS